MLWKSEMSEWEIYQKDGRWHYRPSGWSQIALNEYSLDFASESEALESLRADDRSRSSRERERFIDSLPGETQADRAALLGVTQGAISSWVKRPSDKRERMLMRGWAMLTEAQRMKIIRTTNNQPQER
uniref:Uncharacterized protein n=1 Tax=uncultured microorganism TaxID=358574 RepID=L8B117_9ZZZZ|nr:hypothetical protein [uncultured microorganism]